MTLRILIEQSSAKYKVFRAKEGLRRKTDKQISIITVKRNKSKYWKYYLFVPDDSNDVSLAAIYM